MWVGTDVKTYLASPTKLYRHGTTFDQASDFEFLRLYFTFRPSDQAPGNLLWQVAPDSQAHP